MNDPERVRGCAAPPHSPVVAVSAKTGVLRLDRETVAITCRRADLIRCIGLASHGAELLVVVPTKYGR